MLVINYFIQQWYIKLIKMDSKYIYNVIILFQKKKKEFPERNI